MSKDKRVKGCPNKKCSMHIEHKKQDSENIFCPKCGTELIYVCARCFSQIEDTNPSHRRCKRCEAEMAVKKEKALDMAKNASGKAIAAVGTVGSTLFAAMNKEAMKQAAKAGTKIVNEAGKRIPKVVKK